MRFLWIIQGAIFLAWQHFLKENDLSYLLSFLFVIIGIIVSKGWLFVSKRHIESMFLTEMELKDVEEQFNSKCADKNINIELNKFILDKKCIGLAEPHKFTFSKDVFSQDSLKEFWKLNLKLNKSFKLNLNNIICRILYFSEAYMTPSDETIFQRNKIRSTSIWLGSILPKFFLLIWSVLLLFTVLFGLRFLIC